MQSLDDYNSFDDDGESFYLTMNGDDTNNYVNGPPPMRPPKPNSLASKVFARGKFPVPFVKTENSNSFPHPRKLSNQAALPPPPLGRPNDYKKPSLDGDETYIQPNVFPQETNQIRRPPCRHPTFSYNPTEPEELYDEPTEYIPPTNPANKRHSGHFLTGAAHLSPTSSRNSSTKSNKSTGESRWMGSGSQTSEDNNANKFQRKASPLMFNSPKLNNTDRYQNSQEATSSPKPSSPKKSFFNGPIRKNNIEDQTYFKHIDRKQAEIILKQLENPQVGNFIVRPGNTTQSGEHPYSVSIVSRVAMTTKVSHLKIRKRPKDGKYALGYIKENEHTYESAKHLVEHHFSYKLKLADNIGEVFLRPIS